MEVDFAADVDEVYMSAPINSALSLANEGIEELSKYITPLVQG